MVTEVDRASEALIARLLAERRPLDGLLAEEGTRLAPAPSGSGPALGSTPAPAPASPSGGASTSAPKPLATPASTPDPLAAPASTSAPEPLATPAPEPEAAEVLWIADPLDGTTNFLYGFPSFCVSLAAQVDGEIVAAAVRDPLHDETFVAWRGGGAWCNGRRLTVGGPPTLSLALVGTGFSYDSSRRAVQGSVVAHVLPSVRDIRRAGAAALDLCWVALGRLDAFYEHGLAVWDWSGGSLVASEAGARTGHLADGTFVAAAPHLYEPLVALLLAAPSAPPPDPEPPASSSS
jgi:fructose-1,6-bisphosphatase/inositol monophosphatase family enzyme